MHSPTTYPKSGKGRTNYIPSEIWYEPRGEEEDAETRYIVQQPREGYYHPFTVQDVQQRIHMLEQQIKKRLAGIIQQVQFSKFTKAQESAPCYGMQWGNTIYLYPVNEGNCEQLTEKPRDIQYCLDIEKYGGTFVKEGDIWLLEWSDKSIRDFYLNNVLIHEIGHIIDDKNDKLTDRECFANYFAERYGYPKSKAYSQRKKRPRYRNPRKRHNTA